MATGARIAILATTFAFAAGCGGDQKKAPVGPVELAEEHDDDAARPGCHPDCQTAKYYRTELQVVLHEVTKCADGPVMVSEDLVGEVTVQYENLTCEEALMRVCEAAELTTERVAVASDAGGGTMHALLVLRPGSQPERLVATVVPPYRRVVRSGPGIVEGGPEGDTGEGEGDEIDPADYWREWNSTHGGHTTAYRPASTSAGSSAGPPVNRRAAYDPSQYDYSGDWKSPFADGGSVGGGGGSSGGGGSTVRSTARRGTGTARTIPYTTFRVIKIYRR